MNKTSIFVKRAQTVHGNKYDYSLVNYKTVHDKVKIVCPKHGEFEQRPKNHIDNKNGCPKCGIPTANVARSKNAKEEFIAKAKTTHGNKYDYTKSKYTNCKDKVIITCPVHGDFTQSPSHHLRGTGCPQCAASTSAADKAMTRLEFIESAVKAHGDKYNYDKVKYVNNRTKVIITCPVHGDFEQTPSTHTRKGNPCGCPVCSYSKAEQDIANYLTAKGIMYEREVVIPRFSKFKRFDFYLPETGLYVEYDGEHHHLPIFGKNRLSLQQARDNRRNQWCAENGVKLLVIHYFDNWRSLL